jgi:hypothetical protein
LAFEAFVVLGKDGTDGLLLGHRFGVVAPIESVHIVFPMQIGCQSRPPAPEPAAG